MPTACAATEMRPPSRVASASLSPSPSAPSMPDAGTCQPSNERLTVDEVCRPIFRSGGPATRPGPLPPTNALTPRAPSAPVRANTTKASASAPLLIHCFAPEMS